MNVLADELTNPASPSTSARGEILPLHRIKESTKVLTPVEREDSTDPPGVGLRGGVEILRLQRTLIHKIEIEITTGRELQRNLTSIRELLVVELQKTSSSTERIEIQQRISRIDILLTQVRTRTDETELRFREFLQRVSTGQIRTETESQTLLQAIWSGYHKSLRNLVRPLRRLPHEYRSRRHRRPG
ncbi:hypothetical protein MTO96_024702 [Rhipicephalus appendiculatus]